MTQDKMKIAILDSGIKQSHPAVIGKQVEAIRVFQDGTISYAEQDTDDMFGHGTAIYNIYRSKLPEAEISCYKIQDGFVADDADCLVAALKIILEKQYYEIINISLGTVCLSNELYEICEKLCHKGTIIIAAFDNNGAVSYPAAYPFVIGVNSSERCRKNNQLEYIPDSIVNIGANGNCQRVAWSGPDYILMEGNSFACAHVGVMAADIIKTGVRGVDNILSALKSISSWEVQKEKKEAVEIKGLFPIQKAALVPFNKEMHSLVRYCDLLKFEIADIYEFKYSPYVGALPAHLLQMDQLSFHQPIKNIESIEWDSFDTLIVGHLDYYEKLTNQKGIHTRLIKKALEQKKKIVTFDYNPEFCENSNVYYPQASRLQLPENCYGKLYHIDKPIVGVFGTSSKQGKYTLQLALRKQFLEMGLRLGQIGTEPTAELFGMDYSFPMGYHSNVNLSAAESILYINYILKNLCEKDVDIILVGSQSNTVPYSFANLSYYPLTQINFLMATQPDVVVLCVNPYDDDDYIDRTIKVIENLAGVKVIALVVFPMKFRDNFSGMYFSKMPLTDMESNDLMKRLQDRHKIKTFILGESTAIELSQLIIDYLSE